MNTTENFSSIEDQPRGAWSYQSFHGLGGGLIEGYTTLQREHVTPELQSLVTLHRAGPAASPANLQQVPTRRACQAIYCVRGRLLRGREGGRTYRPSGVLHVLPTPAGGPGHQGGITDWGKPPNPAS